MGSSSKKVVVGYKYYLGFHMVLCHGPITALKKIYAGERLAWSGNVTSSQPIEIDNDELFGGDRREGGVKGTVDVLMGESDQGKNSYLVGQLVSDIPAFRGVFSLIGNRVYVAAGSAYMKPWWPQVENIVQTAWYSAKANISSGSANAAHIIRECLLNVDWGLGLSVTELDDSSFVAMADALYTEGFGLSMLLSNQSQVHEFIQEVLKHVQGVIYQNNSTGKYTVKLIRGDYSVGSLPIFDESNILFMESYDKPSPAELLSEIIIKYRPRGTPTDAAAAFQNLATVESQGGGVVSQTVNYPGVDSHAIAATIAARELRQQSAQLSKIKIRVNRDAWDLNIGDVFKFTWSALGISALVMRINKIDFGELSSPEIIIDALEDVFALSNASYLNPVASSWIDPVSAPIAITLRRLEEANWWDLTKIIDQANLDLITNTSSYVKYIAIEPAAGSYGYQFWTKPSGGEYVYADYQGFAPDALLVNAIDSIETTDIQISGLDNAEAEDIRIGMYGIIDDEYVRVDAVDVTNGLMTIGRGCLDTVAVPHNATIRVWFAEESLANDFTEYADGETVYSKGLTQNGLGLLAIGDANEDNMEVDARQYKPYPPGQFKFNTVYYPEAIEGVLTISWAHRDRLLQTATIVDHTNGDIGPEAGTTYTLQLYDEDNNLVKTYTGLSGTSQVWTSEVSDSGQLNNNIRAVLKAVRDGVDSHQSHDFTVDRAGYGFHHGQYYGGI